MTNDSAPICQRKCAHFLKVPLKSTEQIYIIFLIPTLINCILYIIHFSSDLVVTIQHFRDDKPVWGCCTLGLMYAPAVAYFMLTVSRPDWWMTDDDKVARGIVRWIALQLSQLIGFVFFALYRYAGLIVLSVDAIILSGEERTKTLNIAAAPAAIELYFFLQAWFQAAPQAVFQTHLLFRETTAHRSYQSVVIQVVCIFMSIAILSVQTTSFQRFESQRVNGRKLPWAMWLKKYRLQELCDFEERAPLQSFVAKTEDTDTDTNGRRVCDTSRVEESEKQDSMDGIEFENQETDRNITTSLNRQISVTPPLPPKNAHITPPPTPLRGITTVAPLLVPEAPAPPRPDSICKPIQSEKLVSRSNENLAESTETIKVPSRRYSKKGLEEDDPVGKFLSFLWWFFFISARILSVAIFYEFYPIYLFIVLGIHYALMLTYLFYYSKYYDVITFFVNLWLGLVYTFSLIEYRIKFKYADKWVLPYYVFVLLQNTLLTLVWYIYAEWDGFWYSYIFYIIFTCMALCILSTTVYHALLKPKKCRVYTS